MSHNFARRCLVSLPIFFPFIMLTTHSRLGQIQNNKELKENFNVESGKERLLLVLGDPLCFFSARKDFSPAENVFALWGFCVLS